MKAVRARVLALSFLLIGATVLAALALSANAAAASVSGTWVSRIAGEGYTQTYISPYGDLVTDEFDVELSLSESGGEVYGTLTSWDQYGTQEFSVDGTVSGSTFYMTAYFGWDGVSYLEPVFTLTIDGDTMYGSGSYVNVGVPITGTFDLKKEGLFGVGGINQVASVIGIVIAVAAIAVALSPGKPSPKGFVPRATGAPYAQQPTPSQQWTTDATQQPYTGGQGVPTGGIGLHYPAPTASERPMTEQERRALNGVTKSPKVNAVGLSVMTIAMAVMINFVVEPVALIMPLFFGLISLGTAIQARKVSSSVALSLQKGTVTEAHVSPRYSGGAWDFGAFSTAKDGQLKSVLSEGAPAKLAFVPDARRVLSVNNTALRKPVEFRAAPGFEALLSVRPPQETQTVSRAQTPSQEDLPPPPDGWGARFCSQCGEPLSDDYVFCRKCGSKRA